MKLVYLTSKKYPADTADKIYTREMSRAFTKLLKENFLMIVAGNDSDELKDINNLNLKLKIKKRKSIYYFFWIPYFTIFRENCDRELVYFSNDPYLLIIAIFWKKFLGFRYKICSDWHQLFCDWKDKFIVSNSDRVICLNSQLRNIIVSQFKKTSEKILVAPDAVDLAVFNIEISRDEAKNRLSLPKNKEIIGYFGRFKTMNMEKGIKTILNSLTMLEDNVLFIAAGGLDEDVEFYKKLAQDLGIKHKCLFFGTKTQQELAIFQKACDILLMPFPFNEHFAYYMSPMKMFEYMASKRPIISSDLPSIRDVLDETNSLLISPDSAEALADGINYILGDKDFSESISRKAYIKVQNYTWDKRAQLIIDFIK